MRNIFYFTPAISVEFCTFAKNINMKLFEYTWFTDFHGAIEDLKSIAMKEDWDYKNNPIGLTHYAVLAVILSESI